MKPSAIRLLAPMMLPVVLVLVGCAGHPSYYDRAADRYEEAIAGERPEPTDRVVRCTVHVTHLVDGDVVGPVSAEWPGFRELAHETVEAMGVFEPGNVRRRVLRPDYHFVFDISIEDSARPRPLSGLIIPFIRTRVIKGRLQVLDERGGAFASYFSSAASYEYRHPLVFFLTPFHWPARAERQARERAFRALAVKLIEDAAEY